MANGNDDYQENERCRGRNVRENAGRKTQEAQAEKAVNKRSAAPSRRTTRSLSTSCSLNSELGDAATTVSDSELDNKSSSRYGKAKKVRKSTDQAQVESESLSA